MASAVFHTLTQESNHTFGYKMHSNSTTRTPTNTTASSTSSNNMTQKEIKQDTMNTQDKQSASASISTTSSSTTKQNTQNTQSTSAPTSVDISANTDRNEQLKSNRLCTIPNCNKRVRSKGLCKAHGGGRRCMVDGCERSSQGQGLCIRHGGGKRCTQTGCTKASQSNGLCKAHGGGLRCTTAGCTKSSQGGGSCRAHGGGQRCEKEGCNKGAQRGGYCAGHGGSRFCQHPDCTKNDRGGGFCAEHGGGKRCDHVGCNKPARKKGKCSYHANAAKIKGPRDGLGSANLPPQVMDVRSITATYNTGMLPVSVSGNPMNMKDRYEHASIRPQVPVSSNYPPQYTQKPYDNNTPQHYMPMHGDRTYETMEFPPNQNIGPRGHYNDGNSNLPPVSGAPYPYKHPHGPGNMMERSPYSNRGMKPGMPQQSYSQWKDASDRTAAEYFSMKEQPHPHQHAYQTATSPYHHMGPQDSNAGGYGNHPQRSAHYYAQPHTVPTSQSSQTQGDGNGNVNNIMYYPPNPNDYQNHTLHGMPTMPLL